MGSIVILFCFIVFFYLFNIQGLMIVYIHFYFYTIFKIHMSCLFNSIAFFLKLNSFEVRSLICDYLKKGEVIMDGMITKDILNLTYDGDYISNMRKRETWGGAIEIQAACMIWNMEINVKNTRDSKILKEKVSVITFSPVNNNLKSIKRIITITWNGYHYEPVKTSKHMIKFKVNKET